MRRKNFGNCAERIVGAQDESLRNDSAGMVKIIGIDPGLASTGVGIICGMENKIHSYSYTSINTSKKDSLPNRLNEIFVNIRNILRAEKPDIMVVEDIFSLSRHPMSGITLGKVVGILLLAGRRADMPVVEVPVREAKKILTGNGNSTKIQLETAVRRILNLKDPIRPYHASDAMGLSLIGFYRYSTDFHGK